MIHNNTESSVWNCFSHRFQVKRCSGSVCLYTVSTLDFGKSIIFLLCVALSFRLSLLWVPSHPLSVWEMDSQLLLPELSSSEGAQKPILVACRTLKSKGNVWCVLHFAELDSPERLRALWSQIRSPQQLEAFCMLVFLFWIYPWVLFGNFDRTNAACIKYLAIR